MSALPTSLSANSVDFTDYKCAHISSLKLSDYPLNIQPTVERMRRFRESIFTVNLEKPLGNGGYGSVYEAKYEKGNEWKVRCAVKIFAFDDCWDKECSMLWKAAGAAHALGLHAIVTVDVGDPLEKMVALIVDYVEGNTIVKLSTQDNLFDSTDVAIIHFSRQMFEFLAAIQQPAKNRSSKLVHGDLYFDNLIWHEGQLTVLDFGLMNELLTANYPVVQKSIVRAPEIYLNQMSETNKREPGRAVEKVRYNESVDIWSVGVLIDFIARNEPLVPYKPDLKLPYGTLEVATLVQRFGMPEASYLNGCIAADKFFVKKGGSYVLNDELLAYSRSETFEKAHQISGKTPCLLLDLLQKILILDPAKRITAAEALKHPFFGHLSN